MGPGVQTVLLPLDCGGVKCVAAAGGGKKPLKGKEKPLRGTKKPQRGMVLGWFGWVFSKTA